jgi:cleavage and polyadenylation specificity factor subunit 2
MLRVTPIYGSRWSPQGQAEEPHCTLVEYAGCRVLMNVGWWPTTRTHTTITNTTGGGSTAAITTTTTTTTTTTAGATGGITSGSGSASANATTAGTTAAAAAASRGGLHENEDDEFPNNLPPHDCLILTDSTLQSIGGLPMYYRQMRRRCRMEKSRNNSKNSISDNGGDPDEPKNAKNDHDENNNNNNDKLTFCTMPQIYATFPTVKMGQMTLYDQHAAISMDGGRPPYSLQDLDDAFAAVQCIKYSQQVYIAPNNMSSLSSSNANTDGTLSSAGTKRGASSSSSSTTATAAAAAAATLSITAHRAGHVVGGAFYILQRIQDETSVVLTSTYHIGRELHLDSSTLVKYGSTPDVLVTKPGGPAFGKFKALAHASSSRAGDKKKKAVAALPPQLTTQVERALIDTVMGVLRRDGNVLLPADAAGRSLELVYLLNRHWEKQRLSAAYNLCWLGPMVQNTAEFSRSQLEWMSTSLGQEFDASSSSSSAQQRNNKSSKGGGGGGYNENAAAPFHFKATHILSSVAELNQLLQDQQSPTCVVATGLSCEGGPARDVLLQWADNPDHAIIFTDSSQCHLRRFFHAPQEQQISTTPAAALTTVMSVDSGGAGGELKTPAILQEQQERDLPVVIVDDDDEQQLGSSTSNSRQKDVSPWTVSAQLLSAWGKAKAEGREMEDSVWIDVPVPRRFPLAGAELQAFLAAEESARQRQKEEEEKRAMLREVELAKGQLRLGEEDTGTSGGTMAASSGGGATGARSSTATTSTAALSETTSKSTRPRKKSRFDQTLFLKFSMPLHST